MIRTALAVSCILAAFPAVAQQERGRATCGQTVKLMEMLARKHGEHRAATGITGPGAIVVVTTNRETHRIPFYGSELACVSRAQAEIARNARPGWRVARYGCERAA